MWLIIFDVDGTLVHSDRRDSKTFDRTYREIYGQPFPSLDWSDFPHVTDDTMFKSAIRQHFERDVKANEITSFKRKYLEYLRASRKETPQHFKQVPGASDLVRNLLTREGISIGIATGGWREPAEVKLGHIQIPYQEIIITGADGKQTREEILLENMELSQTDSRSFDKVVYVGDAVWDVRTTRNLNLPFVGIRHRADKDVLLEAGAKTVIQDYLCPDTFLEAVRKATPPGPLL
jgi:phosphoglycolate phosphatase-like HAD superfamily hydrolase